MKRVILLGVTFVIFLFKSSAQDNVWTSGWFDDYLDVDTNRPSNSIEEGINIGRHYNTNIQLATKTFSGHHAIFFNAYKSSSQVSGNLIKAGNSKFANSTTSWGNGAGLISFYANGGTLDFYISDVSTGENTNVSWGIPKLRIKRNGKVGINTSAPDEMLTVNGKIHAEEIRVDAVPSSDYVFDPDYKLRPIEDVEAFVKENKHLPDIPSAEEFKENGVGLGEMDDMLLRKVEELTLYVIDQNGKNKKLLERIEELEKENEELKSQNKQYGDLLKRVEKLEEETQEQSLEIIQLKTDDN